ncbi:MAG: RNA-binding cell elongation regulator Jag/EloR [Oscillospiraceae bacterium]
MEKIFVAKTIDEAKTLAANEFGTEIAKITFDILEEPRKGLFGKLKGEAKISASYEPSKADIASAYIKEILTKMELNNNITTTEIDGGAEIEIEGDDSGTIIGRRGETLDALQYLASMASNKNDKEYYRISVDSCGYRQKRKETLEELAVKIAKSVLKNGRTSALEPMNPYERRIIHSAVSTVAGVNSHSTGDEPYRKVIISPVNKRPEAVSKPAQRPKQDNFKKRQSQPVVARSLDLKTSFEKDYKKPDPKPEDSMKGELYGKINVD